MNTNEIKNHIYQFLNQRYQLVIATQGEHPWIATVYYSIDEDLNLYFLSNPKTIHCQHIEKNSNVAVAISDSPQIPSQKKKGVQIFGIAEQITGKQKIVHALTLWRKTLKVTSDAYTYEGIVNKLIVGRMYKVTPKKIKFFNEELWEEGREPLIEV